MTTRTNQQTVTFRHPFKLASFGTELPAGSYNVETDEKFLEGISFPVYRRIATLIHLHAHAGLTQTLTVDPTELDTALTRNKAFAEKPAIGASDQKTANATTGASVDDDFQAIERAEAEGMFNHPR